MRRTHYRTVTIGGTVYEVGAWHKNAAGGKRRLLGLKNGAVQFEVEKADGKPMTKVCSPEEWTAFVGAQ